MSDDPKDTTPGISEQRTGEPQFTAPRRELSAAASRALDEAAERRRLAAEAAARPKEIDGRGGAEPVRFGDWEVKGLAVDF